MPLLMMIERVADFHVLEAPQVDGTAEERAQTLELVSIEKTLRHDLFYLADEQHEDLADTLNQGGRTYLRINVQ